MLLSIQIKSAAIASMFGVGGIFPHDDEGERARTVVLVHGAFLDGSSWRLVIPILRRAGLKVIAAHSPLDSLANDIEHINRTIEAADGPVVLVGHSYGGVVITEAGCNAKVKSLVYISAFAPQVGHSMLSQSHRYPAEADLEALVKDDNGYMRMSDEGIRAHLSAGLSADEQEVMAATQGILSRSAASAPVMMTAWLTKPTFVLVSANDTIASPLLQRDQARRMNGVTLEIAAGHVPMLTHPEDVARLILQAGT